MVRTIGSQFSKHEFLSLKILEAFIQSMPDGHNTDPGIVKVNVEKGKDFKASIEKGWLYSMPEIQTGSELRLAW